MQIRERFGQSPIHHGDDAVMPHHDVIGLDVAMNHALIVSKRHSLTRLQEDG